MADRPTLSALLRTATARWWRRVQDEPRRPLALTTLAVLAAGLVALDGGIQESRDDVDRTGGLAAVTYVEESARGCADDVTRWLGSPDMDDVMYEVGTTSCGRTAAGSGSTPGPADPTPILTGWVSDAGSPAERR